MSVFEMMNMRAEKEEKIGNALDKELEWKQIELLGAQND